MNAWIAKQHIQTLRKEAEQDHLARRVQDASPAPRYLIHSLFDHLKKWWDMAKDELQKSLEAGAPYRRSLIKNKQAENRIIKL